MKRKRGTKEEKNSMTKKIYELIFVDPVWDNWEHMGWVTDLKNAAPKFRGAVVGVLTEAMRDGAVIMKDGVPLTEDEVEEAVVMPDDFIQEYPSTFCMCIDRPYVTIEELVDECLPGWELKEPYDGECWLCIRGFVQELPANVVDGLMAWEDAVDAFENIED